MCRGRELSVENKSLPTTCGLRTGPSSPPHASGQDVVKSNQTLTKSGKVVIPVHNKGAAARRPLDCSRGHRPARRGHVRSARRDYGCLYYHEF